MRYMVIVKCTENEGAPPEIDPQIMADMNKFNDELLEAGVLLGYDGLHPSSKGALVHFSGKKCTVTDGPFAETKELIAGFWFWKVKSLEEAIEWVKRCPNQGETNIEIRQVFEPEDFATAFNDEEIQKEKDFRARMAANAAKK
ncbi:MAG TPA: YciI family protein [Verrucomicrobiae bacterium]|nr:YciI family protein [Verrucomicrobiae bacterium]